MTTAKEGEGKKIIEDWTNEIGVELSRSYKKRFSVLCIRVENVKLFLKKFGEICPYCKDYQWGNSVELWLEHMPYGNGRDKEKGIKPTHLEQFKKWSLKHEKKRKESSP